MNDPTGGQTVQALRAVQEPIPEGWFWDEANQTFRDESGDQSTEEFDGKWWARLTEFPVWPGTKPAPLPLTQVGPAENTRVHETIASDKARQHALLDQIEQELQEKQNAQAQDADAVSQIRDRMDMREADIAELLTQRREAIGRIDLYGQMIHLAKMDELRRAHS